MKIRQFTNSALKNPIVRIVLGTAFILSIPLVAMLFTDEVKWGPFDFAVIGTLLISAGLLYVLITRNMPNKDHRFIAGAIITAMVLYLWAELAVGVFTNWGS